MEEGHSAWAMGSGKGGGAEDWLVIRGGKREGGGEGKRRRGKGEGAEDWLASGGGKDGGCKGERV